MINFFEALTILLALIHFSYLLYLRNGLFAKNEINSNIFQKVSIVIPTRNEEANIANCIHSLLNQKYDSSNFDIIIVDDHSSDATCEIVKRFLPNEKIKLIELNSPQINSSKINALTAGIKYGDAEIILTTDGDCIVPQNWIESHLQLYDQQTALVTGATTFINPKNTFINTIQSLEYAGHNSILGSAIGKNKIFTSNGSNLSFKKKVFEEVFGFDNIPSSISGEDTFFAHKIYKTKKYKIKFLFSSESLVKTIPANNIIQYLFQRARWVNQTSYFPIEILPFLISTFLFYFCMLILSMITLYDNSTIFVLAILFTCKILIDLFFLYPYLKKLLLTKLLKYFLMAEIIHIPITVLSVFMGYFGSILWKGRTNKN
ncbi:MAG: glycosyltransferase [Bacteroidetes bacterium]|nr:glycosyltransferase [Bacteroidota bacterium]